MNQSQASQVIQSLVTKRLFDVAGVLTQQLRLPSSIVRISPHLHTVVNDQRTLVINVLGRSVTAERGNFNYAPFEVTQAACYYPEYVALGVSTPKLSEEAEDANVHEHALLEILCLHEMVHFAMMGGFAAEPKAKNWITSSEYRYIHEIVALKACEFCFASFYSVAARESTQAYVAYVERKSNESGFDQSYREYFKTYQNLAVEQVWETIRKDDGARKLVDEIALI